MTNLSPTKPFRPIPKGRKVIQLATFTQQATERDLLNQLAFLSGPSATEKNLVSKWRSQGLKTLGDRRCFKHMAFIHLGVRL